MASTDRQTIAEVYARSLLELAQNRGALEDIDQEFAEFAAFAKIDPDFRSFFTSRVVDDDKRRNTLDKIFSNQMSELLLNFLQVLNEKGRTDLILEIQRQFHELYLTSLGVVEAHVTTAEQLSETSRLQVIRVLEEKTGKKITLVEHVDESLIGGVLIRTADEKIDYSVAQQLERFKQIMSEQASQRIHEGAGMFEGAEQY